MTTISSDALDQLFFNAHTAYGWQDKPVDDALLRKLYETLRMAPTAANSNPARIVFVRTPEAKRKLKDALSPGNVDKTMAAPVTAILAYDMEFYEKLPRLMPHVDARSWFAGNAESILHTAKQSGTLQGAYLILAARALGLDCGPMGGFDAAKVDALFLEGTTWRSNFLVNLGYADVSKNFPRNPRLDFDETCKIV